jgi:hypothetical protein
LDRRRILLPSERRNVPVSLRHFSCLFVE